MTPGTPKRHLFIVSSTCESEGELDSLETAVNHLREVMEDPDIGACAPGLPDGSSVLYGDLEADQVRISVRDAIAFARDQGAILVLAWLGHGFVPGGTEGSLYFMVKRSQRDDRVGAVNVTELIEEAADTPGVGGLIGIIDTCTAAAGTPRLVTGTRLGKTRCDLLMASVFNQQAYDLRLTRKLVAILREGAPAAGPVLNVDDVKARLHGLHGQNATSFSFNGDRGDDLFWLARNRCAGFADAATAGSGDLGPGAQELLPLLRTLGLAADGLLDGTLHGLKLILTGLRGLPESPERRQATSIVDSLAVAVRTTAFLQTHFGPALSTRAFRIAAAAAGMDHLPLDIIGTGATVEHVAVNFPVVERNCRSQVARFLVGLSIEGGWEHYGGLLSAWADENSARAELNDAAEAIPRSKGTDPVRLVLELAESAGEPWPEVVPAWIVYNSTVYAREHFVCEPEYSQPGAEKAVKDAVYWAEDHARNLGHELRAVDIAVPTRLLARWRPEEITYVRRLGLDYELSIRWSGRLIPSREGVRTTHLAARRLAEFEQEHETPHVDWLELQDISDLDRLRTRLTNGQYSAAIGLGFRPIGADDILRLLLRYSPILLWPQNDELFPFEKRETVRQCWHQLPAEILVSYRRWWRHEQTSDIADLRAVWEDQDWLDFCLKIHGAKVDMRSVW